MNVCLRAWKSMTPAAEADTAPPASVRIPATDTGFSSDCDRKPVSVLSRQLSSSPIRSGEALFPSESAFLLGGVAHRIVQGPHSGDLLLEGSDRLLQPFDNLRMLAVDRLGFLRIGEQVV